MAKTKTPQWVKPERQNELALIAQRIGGTTCLRRHKNCTNLKHYLSRKAKLQTVFTNPVLVKSPLTNWRGQSFFDVVYEVKQCPIVSYEIDTLYDVIERDKIKDWTSDDRLTEKWLSELRHHCVQRNNPLRGKFSGVARDIFHESQPLFYREAIGVSATTHKPFAVIRLSSSNTRLHVDLSKALAGLGKNARHKALRYGKHAQLIHSVCKQAVEQYLSL